MRKVKAAIALVCLSATLAFGPASGKYGYIFFRERTGAGLVFAIGATIACATVAGPGGLVCGLVAAG